MNITFEQAEEDEEHSLEALRAKYAKMPWVQALNFLAKCSIGAMWAMITWVSILGCIKLIRLVKNQYYYNYYKEKLEKEVSLYEDEDCINQTIEKYKKFIIQHYDRLDRYDPKIRKGIYRYTLLFFIVLALNIAWFFIEYMRSCMLHGIILWIIYQLYQITNNNIIKPYLKERELNEERKRLDEQIAKNKKEN